MNLDDDGSFWHTSLPRIWKAIVYHFFIRHHEDRKKAFDMIDKLIGILNNLPIRDQQGLGEDKEAYYTTATGRLNLCRRLLRETDIMRRYSSSRLSRVS